MNELVLKFEEDKKEFSFEDKLAFTDDKKLVKTLSRPNIKNGNSSLIIKSMNNLPIYDVIQLKINVLETGTFLVNFDKESFDQEKRENLITAIKELKDNDEPTLEKQKEKINKLISILNDANPMFATFKQNGDINVTFEDFKLLTPTSFILLVLGKKQKEVKLVEKEEIFEEEKTEVEEIKPIEENFDISETVVIKPLKDVSYTGEIVKPHPFVRNGSKILKENVDYVVYCDDFEIGEATSVIEFIGKYEKTTQFELQFKILDTTEAPKESKHVKEKIKAKTLGAWNKVKSVFKKKPKEKKEKKSHKIIFDFPLFTFDYLFIALFTLLFGFGVYAGIFEMMIGESISVFLIILAVIFLGVLYFSFYSSTFKRKTEKHKNQKYWMLLYVFAGASIGIVAGFLITTYALKIDEDKVVNLSLLFGISVPVTIVLSFISPFVSKLINLIVCKIKK